MFNEIYLRRRGKVIVPPGTGSVSPQVVVSLLANVQRLGFTLSGEMLNRLGEFSLAEIGAFHGELIGILQRIVGDGRKNKPMYPNFPEQVMSAPVAELYFNAIIHYWTNALPVYKEKKRPDLDEPVTLRPIGVGTVADLEEIFTQLVARPGSLAVADVADVKTFIQSYGAKILTLIPAEIPSRETVAIVGASLLELSEVGEGFVRQRVTTATDVLRLAVALSDGDVSLAQSTKFKSFGRARRKVLLALLESVPNLQEDMLRWRARWIRLGERLHPGEFKTRFPKTYEAFRILRSDEPVERFSRDVELALEKRNVLEAVEKLSKRPGELARRLDHLLRLSAETENEVLAAFGRVADGVSTQVLIQVWGHFTHRNADNDLRVFFPKGHASKATGIPDNLPALSESARMSVVKTTQDALRSRFAKLPALGRCYLSEELRKFPVPMAMRSASKALVTLPRGSRLALPDATVIRMFIWWKNGQSRTDIDLSAAFYDVEYQFVSLVSYYNLKEFGCGHSGDIVDAPNGAAEYIDVTLQKLRERKVRYVVMSVNSYTVQPFKDLPECYAGWMARQKPEKGAIFEPSTVQNRVDLAGDSTISLPMILDLEANEVIWCDLALTRYPSFNNVHANEKGVSVMLRSMVQLRRMSLYDLFKLHIEARGTLVESPEEADEVFSLEAGITPYQVDLIAAEYM